ncbi:MAG: tRNA (adenosine(37)-N6)-dimethylallyltransferase MiaA [Bacteroidota bacterium]|nr:tRNA (adenosine(37)-N6)-dimethylallyltransferase MiaA [Bacteroidota bacterium]
MKLLVVLTGPTGVGKTRLSLKLAQFLNSPVISCDSRQMYREMRIGTAAPDPKDLEATKHFFIGNLSIHDYYNAARFETEALALLDKLFVEHDVLLMTGGSMFYIDAVCFGIDDMPDVDPQLRKELEETFKKRGLSDLLGQLKLLDPEYYHTVDKKNHKRVLHALEICLMTGKPFSAFHRNTPKKRSFDVLKICLNRDRAELYRRIDQRVLLMVQQGLVEEARSLYPYKGLNALNTVGYQELFDHFEDKCSLEEAISKIQFNTHKYARKQLTWFRKDRDYHWLHPDREQDILNLIQNRLKK